MEVFGYIASFAMGIVLGLMGGGGSILTVPIMVYLFGFSPTVATGNSLFVVGLTALIGGVLYVRRGEIDFKVGLAFALPSVVGVSVSRGLIIPQIPEVVLRLESFALTKEILIMGTFAVLMMVASYSMIKGKRDQRPLKASVLARTSLIAIQGFAVGLIAGFVGAGGGFLIIPALVVLAGLSMRVAVGTSLMIIAVQSLLGFAGDVFRGALVNWAALGVIAFIAACGILVGSHFAHRVREQTLKISFGWFVLAMGAFILIEQFRHISIG